MVNIELNDPKLYLFLRGPFKMLYIPGLHHDSLSLFSSTGYLNIFSNLNYFIRYTSIESSETKIYFVTLPYTIIISNSIPTDSIK